MERETIIELVGYLGSALVLVAFLMTSVVKLRIVNSIGSMIFAIYALIIHSYPTALMNFCLVLINVHYLWRRRRTSKVYDLVCVDQGDRFLRHLLDSYRDDINACFPGIDVDLEQVNRAMIVCCEGTPAGVVLGSEADDIFDVKLDYTTPAYRDFSVGEYIFSKLEEKGARKIIYSGPEENHRGYLEKMGFQKVDGKYVKERK